MVVNGYAGLVRSVIEGMGLDEGSKGLDVAAMKADEMKEGDDQLLEGVAVTEFRKIPAIANYLAQDRPDIQYATGHICAEMFTRTVAWIRRLKRLARYLVQHPVVKWTFHDAEKSMGIDRYADSDWAGDRISRRLTSGWIVVMGGPP